MAADTIVGGMGVNIANSTEQGHRIHVDETVSGGITVANRQPPIGSDLNDTTAGGSYVRDQLHPNGDVNAIGCNPEIAYDTDVLNEWSATVQFVCPANSGATPLAKDALWVKAGGTIAKGNRCAVASGVATADTVAGGYDSFTAAKVDQYLWVVTR
jgi:hypothetical protein